MGQTTGRLACYTYLKQRHLQLLRSLPELDSKDACAQGVVPDKSPATVFTEVEVSEDCLVVVQLSWQCALQYRVAWPKA